MNLRYPLAIAVAAAALQACSDVNKVSGNYRLVGDVNSKLPVLLEEPFGCQVMLEGGALEFHDKDKYDSMYRIVMHCPQRPDSVVPDPGARGGRFEQRGDTIAFFNEREGPAGIAVLRADTLKITGPQHTLIYLKD